MKINAAQWQILNAKLEWLQSILRANDWNARLTAIEDGQNSLKDLTVSRLAAIEERLPIKLFAELASVGEAQGVLLERMDAIAGQVVREGTAMNDRLKSLAAIVRSGQMHDTDRWVALYTRLDKALPAIQGALLLQQFKANAKGATKPCRAKKQKRRK